MSNPQDYTVGCICALTIEAVALRSFLDEEHPGLESVAQEDHNAYTLGRMGPHNVVIAALPMEYGLASAAGGAKDMLRTFTNLRISLLVGIGGGAPTSKTDIRLGDVIVSCPGKGHGGVLQYDFGKTIQGREFQRTAVLDQPPELLRATLSALRIDYESHGHSIKSNIEMVLTKRKRLRRKYSRPDPGIDVLYASDCIHPMDDADRHKPCSDVCTPTAANIVRREPRDEDDDDPMIHYGLIASANQVMRDATLRDTFAREHGVLCFEMEAAGLMNRFPCLVIRGISDYSDTHKRDDWHGYAAMTAAAFARDLVQRLAPSRVHQQTAIVTEISDLTNSVQNLESTLWNDERKKAHAATLNWLTNASFSAQQSNILQRRQKGTGQWFLGNQLYQIWLEGKGNTLIATGMPGAGKTFIAANVIEHLQQGFRHDPSVGIAYVFFDFRQQSTQQPRDILANLLKQLSSIPEAFEMTNSSPGDDYSVIQNSKKRKYDGYRKSHNIKIEKTESGSVSLPRKLLSIPKILEKLHGHHQKFQSSPERDELQKTLISVVNSYESVFLVIDALDESPSTHGAREDLLKSLAKIQRVVRVNILITSRPIIEISSYFENCEQLDIHAHNSDVKLYVDHNVSRIIPLAKYDSELCGQICASIVGKANGMFLLAMLHLNSLSGKATKKQVINTLNSISSTENDLDRAYEKTMDMIVAQQDELRDIALKAICWVTFSKRLLNISELKHALAVEIGNDRLDPNNIVATDVLSSACGGLIAIKTNPSLPGWDSTVHLVHETAQKYFEATADKWFPDWGTDLTRVCIAYLSFTHFDSGPCNTVQQLVDREKSFPFHKYASSYWTKHKSCNLEHPLLRIPLLTFLQSDAHVAAHYQTELSWANSSLGATTLSESAIAPRLWGNGYHVAVDHGLAGFITELVSKSTVRLDSKSLSASSLATQRHQNIVQDCSSSFPALDVNLKDSRGRTPLHLAIQLGATNCFSQLLCHPEVDVNVQNLKGQTPLLLAVEAGATFAVDRLVDFPGIDINRRHHEAPRTLGATELGVDQRLQLAPSTLGHSPIHLAIQRRDLKACRMLLSNSDININVVDMNGRTPLALALQGWQSEIVKLLLLRSDIDININDRDGRTPLHEAFSCAKAYANDLNLNSKESLVLEMLSLPGIDIHHKDIMGREALLLAATHGFKTSVRALLNDPSTNPNTKDCTCTTPLYAAMEAGHFNIAKLLLRHDRIEILASQPPILDHLPDLHDSHQHELANLFAARIPPDPGSQKWIESFLDNAARAGCKIIFDRILQYYNLHCKSNTQSAAQPILWNALFRGDPWTTRFLVAGDYVDCNARSSKGDTPLSYAVRSKTISVICVLLDAGADVDGGGPECMLGAHNLGADDSMSRILRSQSTDKIRRAQRAKLASRGKEKKTLLKRKREI